MKRIMPLFVLPLFIALTLPATAAAQRGIQIGFAGGPTFPLGNLAAEAGTGFHLLGGLALELPLLPVGARADLIWQRFPDEHSGHFTSLGGLLNATLRVPLAVPLTQPYLFAGAGLVNHEAPVEDHVDHTHAGTSGSEFAFNLGAGVRLRLLGFGGFAEARYLDWGHGNRAVPLTLGITF